MDTRNGTSKSIGAFSSSYIGMTQQKPDSTVVGVDVGGLSRVFMPSHSRTARDPNSVVNLIL